MPNYKLTNEFYENVARRYRLLVESGDKTPIKTMQTFFYSSRTTRQIQAWTTECVKRGLLKNRGSGKVKSA